MARKREAERVAAVERVRREGIERKNRLAAGIHLLEIPSQLNQVFTKLDGNNRKPTCVPFSDYLYAGPTVFVLFSLPLFHYLDQTLHNRLAATSKREKC